MVGTALIGDIGWINDGSIDARLNGQIVTWVLVDFDSGVAGWVVRSSLAVGTDFLMTKEAQTCLPAEFNRNRGGQNRL